LIAKGGNLSFEKIRKDYKATTFFCLFKLLLMAGLGWFLSEWLDVKGLVRGLSISLAPSFLFRK
jgi:hypothetical protein